MDLLSQTLATAHLRSAVLAMFELSGEWGVDCEDGVGSPCHYVLDGTAWLVRDDAEPLRLQAGDLVMLPRWGRHALVASPDAPAIPIRELLARSGVMAADDGTLPAIPVRLTIPGQGARCRMLSMVFRAHAPHGHPLLAALPSLVRITAADATMSGLLEPAVRFIVHEAEHARGGYGIVAHRLAEVLFMQVVRAQMLVAPEQTTGLLRGLSEPGIARALAAMHRQPGHPWTVTSLARTSGLSRTVFAERFRTLTGATPFQYLTGLRMVHARTRLRDGAAVKAVAGELGYASSFAFAQAFKRHFGCPPSRHGTLDS